MRKFLFKYPSWGNGLTCTILSEAGCRPFIIIIHACFTKVITFSLSPSFTYTHAHTEYSGEGEREKMERTVGSTRLQRREENRYLKTKGRNRQEKKNTDGETQTKNKKGLKGKIKSQPVREKFQSHNAKQKTKLLPTCNQGIDVATSKRVGRGGWGYVMMPRAPLLPRAVGNWRRTLLSNCFSRRHDITTRLAGGGPVAMCCWSLHTAATTPTLVWVTQS